MIDIYYFGHASFKIKGKESSVLLDPFNAEVGFKFAKETADILLISHDHAGHNNRGSVFGNLIQITGPGEYELKGATVVGYATFHDDEKGKTCGKNTVYKIKIDGVTFTHLGDLGSMPSKSFLDEIGETDVLMVPAGGLSTISPRQASEIASKIEPKIILPMHYKTKRHADRFAKMNEADVLIREIGVEVQKVSGKISLTKDKLPEQTKIYMFEND